MFDYTLALVMYGATLLGCLAGMIGCFVLLRQQSLLGDALSHAALPGTVIMFLITQSKNVWILLIGGALAGIAAVLSVGYVLYATKLKKDAILGIILSVFFGLGLVLLTFAQKVSAPGQAILQRFLFGNVATLLPIDIWVIQIMFCIISVIMVLFWKECILSIFDPSFFVVMGFSSVFIECIIMMLVVLVIIMGLQAVGVVLMSTMLIAPAAAARQWTSKPSHMVAVAGFFGAFSAVVGVYISSLFSQLPTGPMIVVVSTLVVIASLIFSHREGALV